MVCFGDWLGFVHVLVFVVEWREQTIQQGYQPQLFLHFCIYQYNDVYATIMFGRGNILPLLNVANHLVSCDVVRF